VSRAVAALALVATAAGCAAEPSPEPDDDGAPATAVTGPESTVAQPGRGGPPPTPHDSPEALEFDPVGPLPPTAVTDRLVVSTVGDDQPPLLLVNLARRRVVALGRSGLERADAVFSGTILAFTIDDRTLGILDVDAPDSITSVSLPDEVPGVISSLVGDGVGFIVAVGVPQDPADPYGRRGPGPYVLYGSAGELRCVTEETIAAPGVVDLLDGVLWIDHFATEVDRTDCTTSPGLRDVGDFYWAAGTIDGDVVLAGDDTVTLYDGATGIRRAGSEPLGDDVNSAAVAAGSIWAMVDGYIVRLDPGTLRVVHRAGPLGCDGSPYVLDGGGSVWVVDDCSGILAEVDPATGDYVDAWWLPTDGESDREVGAAVVDDGIWFVDVEQTGEPYRLGAALLKGPQAALGTALSA
jgi:hypothetical protein